MKRLVAALFSSLVVLIIGFVNFHVALLVPPELHFYCSKLLLARFVMVKEFLLPLVVINNF